MEIIVGTPLYGYCGGQFGRDSYDNKRIEGVGYDWLVVRCEDGTVELASFDGPEQMKDFVAKHSHKPEVKA